MATPPAPTPDTQPTAPSDAASADALAARLAAWFADCDGALVAFSGGVDSCLVAAAAHRLLGADRMRAVMSASPSLKRRDLAEGQAFCDKLGIPLDVIQTKELAKDGYTSNPSNRCYFCKSTLYDDLAAMQQTRPTWWVMNGQNLDDAGDHRPGIQAAEERAVRRPLADCQFTKQDVRTLAQAWGLPTWDKPASPCLSSRIPYGQPVTLDKLHRIEAAENWLNDQGFPIVRVRHDGLTARIEVPTDAIDKLKAHAEATAAALLPLGFEHIAIDEEGFVSGKLNRVLTQLTVTPSNADNQ